MEYLRTKAGTIYTALEVGDSKLRLTARDIKKRGSNLSAIIGIYWNENQLEYSVINPDDMRARAGLAASAWQVIPNEYKGMEPFGNKPENLKAELALFCEGLWDAHVGRIQVESITPRNNLPPPQFVGPYILEEGGTLLFGLPGQGKSWTAYLLAATINSGTRSIWHSVTQKRVLFLNLERGPLQFESKMASVYRALGIQGQYPMDVINARGKTLQDVKDRVLKHIETNGNEVLFLDSLSRAGAGSMVKDDVANEVMDTLSAMCPTWLAIAHEKHADTDATGQPKGEHHTFGSQMFRGAADLEVHLESIQSPGRLAVTLTPKKSNVLIDWQPEVIYLDMDDRGVRSISRPWQEARRT